jgi:hypothetical protein
VSDRPLPLIILLIFLSGFTERAFCAQPWLMAFPEISYDADRVCFSNVTWTAYYDLKSKSMYTIPQDSIALPPKRIPTNTVAIGQELFSYRGSEIERVMLPQNPKIFALPELTAAAAKPFMDAWKDAPRSLSEVRETIGPMAVSGMTLWFGLTAEDGNGNVASGIGWFHTYREQFGRIYSPSLVSNKPIWVDVVRDTVVVLLESLPGQTQHLVFYSTGSGRLSDLDYRQAGIPGEKILGIDRWKGFILLATDQAVAIWAPGYRPNVWTTSAYVARRPLRLKMLKFINGKPDYSSAQDFLPMRENRPSEIMAQVDDMVEIVAHAGVEGFASEQDWEKYGERWHSLDWGCKDKPCFVRVRVPTRDTYLEGDLYNTPLTYIASVPEGVKIGFAAGWVPLSDLTPALLPYP